VRAKEECEREKQMELTIFAGSANAPLAEAVAAKLNLPLGKREVHRFPDGELHVEIQESVRGHDVYLVQPTNFPAEKHLIELLLLADASHRAGATRLTAIIPYFGYARQDRRASGREAVAARLVAELLGCGALLERVVTVDVHTGTIEGFFGIPMEHLSAVPMLVKSIGDDAGPDSVVVAPDLGAVKLAERYAKPLALPVAMVHKSRISGSEVSVRGTTGEVRGRKPIIVDDMISTGGTIKAAIETLLEEGCEPQITVVASHGLFVGPALERLSGAPVRRFVVTDSVRRQEGLPLPLEVVSLAPLLAEAIERLYNDRSLDDLIAHA
jgi:ribose-phosphate pyrophosphokinase